jgi:hypothetical protein
MSGNPLDGRARCDDPAGLVTIGVRKALEGHAPFLCLGSAKAAFSSGQAATSPKRLLAPPFSPLAIRRGIWTQPISRQFGEPDWEPSPREITSISGRFGPYYSLNRPPFYTFNEHNEKRIAGMARCIRCGAREPQLTVIGY